MAQKKAKARWNYPSVLIIGYSIGITFGSLPKDIATLSSACFLSVFLLWFLYFMWQEKKLRQLTRNAIENEVKLVSAQRLAKKY